MNIMALFTDTLLLLLKFQNLILQRENVGPRRVALQVSCRIMYHLIRPTTCTPTDAMRCRDPGPQSLILLLCGACTSQDSQYKYK